MWMWPQKELGLLRAPWSASYAKKVPDGICVTFPSTFLPVFSCVTILFLHHTLLLSCPCWIPCRFCMRCLTFYKVSVNRNSRQLCPNGLLQACMLSFVQYSMSLVFPVLAYNEIACIVFWKREYVRNSSLHGFTLTDGAWSFCPLTVHGNQLLYVTLTWGCQVHVLTCTHMNWKALWRLTVYA